MDSGKNGSIKVLVWEAHFEWKTIEMVDSTSKIRFKACGKENHQRKHHVRFLCQEPMEREDGKEDFPNEVILDIKLRAWKMYFDGDVNQYGNGIGILLITLKRILYTLGN